MRLQLIALTLGLLACGPAPPPHIILVSADALRPDHLSMNGYSRETSPVIDAFAKRAWNFTQAITVIPKTCPSFATLFTGLSPAEHGVRHNRNPLPAEAPLLAEIFAANGYRTAAFVSNPVLHRRVGFNRGFDVYEIFRDGEGPEEVNRAFAKWARADWTQPTFVWIHYIDPHGPYTPPAEFSDLFAGDSLDGGEQRAPTEYARMPGYNPNKVMGAIPKYQLLEGEDRVAFYVRQYDAEIRSVDHAFGGILSLLRDRGLFDSSAIVFTADHGESLGEHDYYFEHGWYAYDASLRIPLLLKQPGQVEPKRVDEQVSNLDIFPTLLSLAGIENRWPGKGRELLAPLEKGRSVVVENSGLYPERFVGLRKRGMKYLWNLTTEEGALYDLVADPGETIDRRGADPETARLAKRELQPFLAQIQAGTAGTGKEAEVPEDVRDQLKRLGYVQ